LKNGFTLLELLVVVLIIGILTAIAVPRYQLAVEKARATEGLTIVRALRDAQFSYYLSHGQYSNDINYLDLEIPGSDENYANVTRKINKNFSFGVKNNITELAVANRIPLSASYVIKATGQDIICRVYNDEGRAVCKSFGGEQVDDLSFESYRVQ